MHAGQVAISRALYGTKELFEVPEPLAALSNVVAYSRRQFFKGSAPAVTNISATRGFARLCCVA
jgi:hypothetical protein